MYNGTGIPIGIMRHGPWFSTGVVTVVSPFTFLAYGTGSALRIAARGMLASRGSMYVTNDLITFDS